MIHVPAMSATAPPPAPLTLEEADWNTVAVSGASPQEPWIDSLGRLIFIEDESNDAVLEHSAAAAQRSHPPALDFSLIPDGPKQPSLQQHISLGQPLLVPRLYWQSPAALWKQAVPEASFLRSTTAPGVATPRSMESCKDRQQNHQQVQDQQEEHVLSLLWAKLPTRNNHLTREEAHLRNVWVFMGLFVFTLLALIPLWNARRLLLDPSYVYFAGKVGAHGIISVCIPLPIFYVCTVSLIFKRGSPQARTERTMLNVGTFFLTVFGLSLLLLSLPMWRAHETSKDLSYRCSTASKTKELFQASQALQRLRLEQACESLHSVVQCPGFQSSAYSDVLQDMERIYQCAGYCVEPEATKLGAPAAAVSFSDVHVQKKKKLQGGLHAKLQVPSAMRAGPTSNYPPTLFSTTNWQASCNGMAANFMGQELGDIANQTFYQGLGLMIMTIVACVLSLL
jgi:hypothetical protein